LHWNYRESRQKAGLLAGLIAAVVLLLIWPEGSFVRMIYGQLFPCAAFCMDTLAYGTEGTTAGGRVMDMVSRELPLYSYSISYYGDGMMNEYYKEYVEILLKEAEEGTGGEADAEEAAEGEETEDGESGNAVTDEAAEEENGGSEEGSEEESEDGDNETGEQTEDGEGIQKEETEEAVDLTQVQEGEQLNEEGSVFVITDGSNAGVDLELYKRLIHSEKKQEISAEDYQEFENLVKTFYTVDSNTYTSAEELNADKFSSADLKISKNTDGPQILIYHTHSQEGYADSVPGDSSTTVVGVGEQLSEILRNEYGYQVLHHVGQYDVEARDYAYSYALPELEKILSDNPTIEVVIDLHRDSVADGTRLVTEIEGVETARFMFFNGLSRVRELGEISYLPNENLQQNLAFSFQMKKACEEYYPGLTRKIYLKGYRYNMHMKPKTLLIELGAQNNTVQEAMNACGPIARILDIVLSGGE